MYFYFYFFAFCRLFYFTGVTKGYLLLSINTSTEGYPLYLISARQNLTFYSKCHHNSVMIYFKTSG